MRDLRVFFSPETMRMTGIMSEGAAWARIPFIGESEKSRG